MEEKLHTLKSILAEVSDLQYAAALLEWDQQCYMPDGGGETRGYQLSTLQRLAHERFTSDEVGGLLEDCAALVKDLDPDSNDARLVKVTNRLYDKRTRVPASLVGEFF